MISRQRRQSQSRRGAAVVEMAIVTPILLTLLFGIIEYGWVFTLRQALSNAAREGARVAVLSGSSDTEISTRVTEYLQPYGMTTHVVAITHATTNDPTEIVKVTIPYADVTLLGAFFGSTNYDLGATCSMRKEGGS